MPTSEELEQAAKLQREAESMEAEIAQKQKEFDASIADLRKQRDEKKAQVARIIGQPQTTTRRARRGEFDEAAVIGFVASHPEGIGASEIAYVAGVSGTSLSNKLAAMVEAGKLDRTGQRRGTKYFAKS